jgi:hypothetical protein
LEITLFIARLLYQFDIQLANDEVRKNVDEEGPYG